MTIVLTNVCAGADLKYFHDRDFHGEFGDLFVQSVRLKRIPIGHKGLDLMWARKPYQLDRGKRPSLSAGYVFRTSGSDSTWNVLIHEGYIDQTVSL